MLLGVIAVVVMLFTFDMSYEELLDNLRKARYYLPLVLLLWFFVYLINTFSWFLIIRSGQCPSPISFTRLYKLTVSGFALNYVTPVGLMGGEPYRIMELSPYIGVERATSSVILYVMMHIFSHFCFWLSAVAIYICCYPVNWFMGIVLSAVTLMCLLLAVLFIKGYREGMAVAMVRMGSHIPFLKKYAIRFAEKHSQKLQQIDTQIALLHQQRKKHLLQCPFSGVHSPRTLFAGGVADPECADLGCELCRLSIDCCFLFLTGQSVVFYAYAGGRTGRRFCPGCGRTFDVGCVWCIHRSDHAGKGTGLDCDRIGIDEDRK